MLWLQLFQISAPHLLMFPDPKEHLRTITLTLFKIVKFTLFLFEIFMSTLKLLKTVQQNVRVDKGLIS